MFLVHDFRPEQPAAPKGSNYAEWSYFDGYHFAHIAARDEYLRIQRKRTEAIKALDRRSVRR